MNNTNRMADLEKENDYLLKVMFAIKEYIENEDYENVIKAINKVSERIGNYEVIYKNLCHIL